MLLPRRTHELNPPELVNFESSKLQGTPNVRLGETQPRTLHDLWSLPHTDGKPAAEWRKPTLLPTGRVHCADGKGYRVSETGVARKCKPGMVREYRQGTRTASPAIRTGIYSPEFRPVVVHTVEVTRIDACQTWTNRAALPKHARRDRIAHTHTDQAYKDANGHTTTVVSSDVVDWSLKATTGVDTRKGISPLGKTDKRRKKQGTDADSYFTEASGNEADSYFKD